MREIQIFDRKQDFSIVSRQLPHWSQAGTVVFITWRTADSLPTAALTRFVNKRAALVRQFGLDDVHNWKAQLETLPSSRRSQLKQALFEAWDLQLDRGAGDCALARPELSEIVANSLQHFDKERYLLTDFVVMPNHVHVLAAFDSEEAMLSQITSWKRFTARQINEALGRSGEFWQLEGFDHLVRSLEQFEFLRRYLAENPERAKLKEGSYRHYSKDLRKVT